MNIRAALPFAFMLAACAPSLFAQEVRIGFLNYRMTSFDVPGAVASPISPSAPRISDLGLIVGYYTDSSNHQFGWHRPPQGPVVSGEKEPNDNFGFTRFSGVNDHGEIVGGYFNLSNGYNGFTLTLGTYATYDVPGVTQTTLSGINNSGDLVGQAVNISTGLSEAFLVIKGKVTFVTYLNENTFGQGMNNFGAMVGTAIDAQNNAHSFYRATNGAMEPITFPNAVSTTAVSINDFGEVCGQYTDTKGISHGFLHLVRTSIYESFDIPGAKQTYAGGLNDFGSITGHYILPNGTAHAYLLQLSLF